MKASSKIRKTVTQIKSKKRVADHGEVYTSEREVNAMLDLVKHETERIDSRFLEPACGNGNFLAEVLRRKLVVVERRYKKNINDWEKNALMAVGSLYGVDILKDNTVECLGRLYDMFSRTYLKLFGTQVKPEFLVSVHFVLEKNIIWGDALDYTNPSTGKPIIFAEWTMPIKDMVKRRDYRFKFLVERSHQFTLFNDENQQGAIDEPVRDYDLVHYLKLGRK